MKDLFSLQGKRILITGAGQGIGFVMAQGLAQYGAEIIINDISASRADDAVMKLRDEGAIAHSAVFNVTDADAVENAIAKIEEEIGAIDVLFNNAGIQRRHPFTEFPVQEWNDVISVNQTAVFLVSQAVAKRMVSRQRGKIVNICSMQSELGRDTITPYAAAKGAVKMLTRGMCVELARYNIQVNGIAPGYFKTAMTQAWWTIAPLPTGCANARQPTAGAIRKSWSVRRCSSPPEHPISSMVICCLSTAACWLPSD
jgi:gluconate 5-dehydrogenase